MAQINLQKVTEANNAPAGKLGIFVTPDNEAFLVDENGAVYAFGGGATNLAALSDVTIILSVSIIFIIPFASILITPSTSKLKTLYSQ